MMNQQCNQQFDLNFISSEQISQQLQIYSVINILTTLTVYLFIKILYRQAYQMKNHNQKNVQQQQQYSDEQLNDQINDKLNQLWAGMNNKRKQLVRNMTPSYSRRTDSCQLVNQSSTATNLISQHQIIKIRQKLAHQVSVNKQKNQQITTLKKIISQLTNDKKMLVYQLQNVYNGNNVNQQNINSSLLNQSSINSNTKLDAYKNTANFSENKKTRKSYNNHNNSKKYSTISQEQQNQSNIKKQLQSHLNENTQKASPNKKYAKLEDLSKNRLLQLLRSTAQYRQFVYYYDSHELSYLKRLQQQHRKHCDNHLSFKQKQLWSPTYILQQFHRFNRSQKLNMNENQIQILISVMKSYYEANYEEKVKKHRQEFEIKVKKIQREVKNSVPYDLVQVCKAKERQLTKASCGGKKNRTNSFKAR